MKEKLTIVKVGGAVVEDELQLSQLLKDFSAIEGRKILVHGGGRKATKMAERLGIETKMVDGRRITDADMLEVVTMVYGGLVNKNLVARLQANGVNALGLTGADANAIRSHKRPLKNGVDYGFVGDVDQANGEMLGRLIEAGITPVMAPLTHDGQGHIADMVPALLGGQEGESAEHIDHAQASVIRRLLKGLKGHLGIRAGIKARCILEGSRPAEKVPLHHLTANGLQKGKLLLRLDSLRKRVDINDLGHSHNGCYDPL